MRLKITYRDNSESITECEDASWKRFDNGSMMLQASNDHEQIVFEAAQEEIRSVDYDYDE